MHRATSSRKPAVHLNQTACEHSKVGCESFSCC